MGFALVKNVRNTGGFAVIPVAPETAEAAITETELVTELSTYRLPAASSAVTSGR
jgi:hypothetical protein